MLVELKFGDVGFCGERKPGEPREPGEPGEKPENPENPEPSEQGREPQTQLTCDAGADFRLRLFYLVFGIGQHLSHSLEHIRLDSERSRSRTASMTFLWKAYKSQTHIGYIWAGWSNFLDKTRS